MSNEYVDKSQLDELKAGATAEENKKKAKKSRSKTKSKRPSAFIQILNGDFLSREFILNNLGFILFIFLLLLLMVGQGYYGKQLTSEVNKSQKELDELTGDYFDAKARLEENTQRSKLIEQLEDTGLKETVNPTKVIRVSTDED
jgi:cell division protein FtsL